MKKNTQERKEIRSQRWEKEQNTARLSILDMGNLLD